MNKIHIDKKALQAAFGMLTPGEVFTGSKVEIRLHPVKGYPPEADDNDTHRDYDDVIVYKKNGSTTLVDKFTKTVNGRHHNDDSMLCDIRALIARNLHDVMEITISDNTMTDEARDKLLEEIKQAKSVRVIVAMPDGNPPSVENEKDWSNYTVTFSRFNTDMRFIWDNKSLVRTGMAGTCGGVDDSGNDWGDKEYTAEKLARVIAENIEAEIICGHQCFD